MGILWSLLGFETKEQIAKRTRVTPPQRIKYLLQHHWRGLFGFLIPVALLPVLMAGGKAKACMYVWLVMLSLFITQPYPMFVVGLIPLFAFPFLGVCNTLTTCKCYLNDMTALVLIGSMLLSVLNRANLDRRFFTWAMSIAPVGHPGLLLMICFSSALLSMVVQKNLVVTMALPIVADVLQTMASNGQAPIATANGGATDYAATYYQAVGTSASIGSLGLTFSSIATLTALAQIHTRYPNMPDALKPLNVFMICFPCLIVMVLLNWIFLMLMLKPKNPMTAASKTAIKTHLKKLSKDNGKWSCMQVISLIMILLLVVLFLARHIWGKNLGGSGKATSKATVYVRDSTLPALFVILLHWLPSNLSFTQYLKTSAPAKLPPVKPLPGVMMWPVTNRHTPWHYLAACGGAVAMMEGSLRSKLSADFSNWAKSTNDLPWEVVLLIVVLLGAGFSNAFNAVPALTIFMPICTAIGSVRSVNPIWAPLCFGLSTNLMFSRPVVDSPAELVHKLKKVNKKRMLILGVANSALCAVVLVAVMSFAFKSIPFEHSTLYVWEIWVASDGGGGAGGGNTTAAAAATTAATAASTSAAPAAD